MTRPCNALTITTSLLALTTFNSNNGVHAFSNSLLQLDGGDEAGGAGAGGGTEGAGFGLLPLFKNFPPWACSVLDAPFYLCEQNDNIDPQDIVKGVQNFDFSALNVLDSMIGLIVGLRGGSDGTENGDGSDGGGLFGGLFGETEIQIGDGEDEGDFGGFESYGGGGEDFMYDFDYSKSGAFEDGTNGGGTRKLRGTPQALN